MTSHTKSALYQRFEHAGLPYTDQKHDHKDQT